MKESIKYFIQVNIFEKIYIVCAVFCVFSGQGKLLELVPQMMLIMLGLSIFFASTQYLNRDIRPLAFVNLGMPHLIFLMMSIVLFLAYQVYFVSYDSFQTTIYCRRYFIYSLFLILVMEADCAYHVIKLSEIYALFAGLTSLVATAMAGTPSGGFYGSRHGSGMMMSVACFMFALEYFHNKRNIKYLLMYLFSLGCVVVSSKRMFLALSVLSLLVAFFITNERKKVKKLFKIFGVMVAAAFTAYIAVPDIASSINEFFSTFTLEDETVALSGRDMLWKMAMIIFNQNRLCGIGFANFIKYTPVLFDNQWSGIYHTHNIYYGLLSETGIIGTTLFLLLFISGLLTSFWALKRVKAFGNKKQEFVLLFSIMAQLWCIVYGFTGNVIYDTNEFYLYMCSLMMTISVIRAVRMKRRKDRRDELEARNQRNHSSV